MDQFANYIKATAQEMKHVKWPTRNQAMLYTVLVVAISAFTAMYAGAFDFLFGNFIEFVVNNY